MLIWILCLSILRLGNSKPLKLPVREFNPEPSVVGPERHRKHLLRQVIRLHECNIGSSSYFSMNLKYETQSRRGHSSSLWTIRIPASFNQMTLSGPRCRYSWSRAIKASRSGTSLTYSSWASCRSLTGNVGHRRWFPCPAKQGHQFVSCV